MQKVHFIAIGGAAMHALAIELKNKGYIITGSDDEIFEPSRSLLSAHNLLPEIPGWFPEKITTDLDAVILGMHAHSDNPELMKALEKGIRVYSYPEFLFEQTKNKKRVVIAGSHGKTTITAMVMHVLRCNQIMFDYLVGSRIEGFNNTVGLNDEAEIAVFEGDEYLASALDKRPKFHIYKPHIALISGIAWDHINVFPTFESYREQFRIFINHLPADGLLTYNDGDAILSEAVNQSTSDAKKIPYKTHEYCVENEKTFLLASGQKIPLEIFGQHNLQNISGARIICEALNVTTDGFYKAISSFKGAGKRLQQIARNDNTAVFLDFAHSPSKVKATIEAVKEQFPDKNLIACFELHTYSSLTKSFLSNYRGTMKNANEAIVFYNPETLKHKRLENISPSEILNAFDKKELKVFTSSNDLLDYLNSISYHKKVLLLMSSGNFGGINFNQLAETICIKNQ
jgi:UDP-N-acetylmuramate: L-alanyl-gamma-D-glutamyl-meso-diaminopimelate ligase